VQKARLFITPRVPRREKTRKAGRTFC